MSRNRKYGYIRRRALGNEVPDGLLSELHAPVAHASFALDAALRRFEMRQIEYVSREAAARIRAPSEFADLGLSLLRSW